MPILNRRWTGPLCVSIAILMLGTQAYLYVSAGLISAWLLGGGLGLLLLGGISILHFLDDKRSGAPHSTADLPTADEYEASLHARPHED